MRAEEADIRPALLIALYDMRAHVFESRARNSWRQRDYLMRISHWPVPMLRFTTPRRARRRGAMTRLEALSSAMTRRAD